MFLKSKLILASFLICGLSAVAMEKEDEVKPKAKLASTAQEWEFLFYVATNLVGIVDSMINEGVDINVEDRHGNSALSIAVKASSFNMIKTLVSNGAIIGKKDLIMAIGNGSDKAAQALIEFGADVNYGGDADIAPIVQTVWKSCRNREFLGIIPLLIKKGANLDYKFCGKTAYDWALEYMEAGNEWDAEILELLKPIEECSICSEHLRSQTVTTKCKHTFHESCLNAWKTIKNNCPLCRQKL